MSSIDIVFIIQGPGRQVFQHKKIHISPEKKVLVYDSRQRLTEEQ